MTNCYIYIGICIKVRRKIVPKYNIVVTKIRIDCAGKLYYEYYSIVRFTYLIYIIYEYKFYLSESLKSSEII